MATTQLFIELLIIGIGVATWLACLVAAILGYAPKDALLTLDRPFLAAFLGIAYVLGIIVDRAAYSLFKPIERQRRDEVFGQNQKPAVDDRERLILVRSSPLRDQIIYNRSRLRICRSWILNFFLIAASAGIWAIQQRAWSIASIALASIVMGVFAAFTANTLVRDHYINIRSSYDFLTNQDQHTAG